MPNDKWTSGDGCKRTWTNKILKKSSIRMFQRMKAVMQFNKTANAPVRPRALARSSRCGAFRQSFSWTLQEIGHGCRSASVNWLLLTHVHTFIRKFAASCCLLRFMQPSLRVCLKFRYKKTWKISHILFEGSRKIKSISTNWLEYSTRRSHIVMQISVGKYCALPFLERRINLSERCMADINCLNSARLNRNCALSISMSQYSESKLSLQIPLNNCSNADFAATIEQSACSYN